MSFTQDKQVFQSSDSDEGDEQAQQLFLQDQILTKRVREESVEQKEEEEEDDLLLSLEESPVDDVRIFNGNSSNLNNTVQDSGIDIDTNNNMYIQNIAEVRPSLQKGPIIEASDVPQIMNQNTRHEHTCENNILIYKCNNIEMKVVIREFESDKVESTNEFSLQKLINMEFSENEMVDGFLPVKCKADKREVKSGTGTDEIIGATYVEGWLDVSSQYVYFGGPLGQVLKCNYSQFVAIGGKKYWHNPRQSLETNFKQGYDCKIQDYELEKNFRILPINSKKQKLNGEFNDSNLNKSKKSSNPINNNVNLSQQKIRNFCSKNSTQNKKICSLNWEISMEIQNLQNLKRFEVAEKIFEKFGDTVRDLVWCDEHEVYRWIRNEGNVFYCPECYDKFVQAQEAVNNLENQKIQFKEKIQNQLNNSEKQIQKLQQDIQVKQEKWDNIDKKIKELKKQADDCQNHKTVLEGKKGKFKNLL